MRRKSMAGKVAAAAALGAGALLRDGPGLAGAGLVAYGAWQIYRPAGFIAAGVLVLAGVVLREIGEARRAVPPAPEADA